MAQLKSERKSKKKKSLHISDSRTCGCPFGFTVGSIDSQCIPDPDSTPPPDCNSFQVLSHI